MKRVSGLLILLAGCGTEVVQIETPQSESSALVVADDIVHCLEEDPIDPVRVFVLEVANEVAVVGVQNVSFEPLTVGVRYHAYSEKNDRRGRVVLGTVERGEAAVWQLSLTQLGLDLSEHLGAGEIEVRPCYALGSEGCRPTAETSTLYFLAGDGRLVLGEGALPPYASEAGRRFAEATGILSDAEGVRSGNTNLTSRATKISDRADFLPDFDGVGGEQ